MGISAIQKVKIGSYVLRHMFSKGKKDRKFPLVLMLEPLFRCNLRCQGCGKINHPPEILKRHMSVDECAAAADECNAPVVSVAGGEPLLHPDIHDIVRELVSQKRFVYLCTNALLVKERIGGFEPSPYLTFNIHLDGLEERHDLLVGRKGVFRTAVEAINLLTSRGFRVTTNTTFFDGATPQEASDLLNFILTLGVDAMTVSPGFDYENAISHGNSLGRETTKALFREIFKNQNGNRWSFNHSILYLEFLLGKQEYKCVPWGCPTRNIFGWQRPCYLISDGYASTYKELVEDTDWDKYGVGNDPRCTNCMVHSGFEPAAVEDAVMHPIKALIAYLRTGVSKRF